MVFWDRDKREVLEKELVAYRIWKCKFCSATRQEASDMWSHLQVKHGIGSVENNSEIMVSQVLPISNSLSNYNPS